MPIVEVPQGRSRVPRRRPRERRRRRSCSSTACSSTHSCGRASPTALPRPGSAATRPHLPLGSHRIPLGPDADLTPRGVARLIIDFLAALDLRDVTLVGNDTGGALCQFVIDTDPERIGALVLTNCDAFDKFPPPPFGLLVKAGRSRAMLKIMAASTRPTVLRHSALGFGPLARNLDAEVTRSWMEPLRTDRAIRADTARFMAGIDKADLLDVSTRLERVHPSGAAGLGRPRPLLQARIRPASRRHVPRGRAHDGRGRAHLRPARCPRSRRGGDFDDRFDRAQRLKIDSSLSMGPARSLTGGWIGQEERVVAPHADAVKRHVVRDRARRLGA